MKEVFQSLIECYREDKMFNFEDVIDDIIPFILTLNEKHIIKIVL